MVATVILSSMAQQAHYFHHNSDRNMLNCKVSTASTRIKSQSRTGLAWAIHNRRLVFEVRKQPANLRQNHDKSEDGFASLLFRNLT
ncbi:hypothetical protein FOQG_00932 [Fusarium oxysporum f. sp. raphani 54005]|uniref:Uncharacterized protein n=3 Tax=Fusarium oxysporum TaxID=5507 RepID=X0D3Q8_FUSOX|nr:hypothetical protein FOVG_02649 [Fusarium oxysporum f. sp. pisi HDV247]EXL01057.1 hypothetical protein FOQG_00932 [Fusarium oxysporum f. sp. raphani 54005]EXL85262.1 hypothetical protein FOPG_02672 [Fusarium oxysporum f. sp. conglutinans race 2 54008]